MSLFCVILTIIHNNCCHYCNFFSLQLIGMLSRPLLYKLFCVRNLHPCKMSLGGICLKNLLFPLFTLHQDSLTWSSFPFTTISIPVCSLKCGATSNGSKNRMINNLISPLITLVQSGKWMTSKRCQDITSMLKWAVFCRFNPCGIQQVWFYTSQILCFQVKINSS